MRSLDFTGRPFTKKIWYARLARAWVGLDTKPRTSLFYQWLSTGTRLAASRP